jgi:hypothetical protein
MNFDTLFVKQQDVSQWAQVFSAVLFIFTSLYKTIIEMYDYCTKNGVKSFLKEYSYSLLTAEDIWFKCDLYLWFIPPITLWKMCIDLRPFSKCFRVPFSRTLRSLRSNNLKIPNDENSK